MYNTLDIREKIELGIAQISKEMKDLIIRTDFEQKMKLLLDNRDYKGVLKQLNTYLLTNPQDKDAAELAELIMSATSEALVSDNTKDYSNALEIAHRLYGNFELNYDTNKKILKVKDGLSYDECKLIAQDIVNHFDGEQDTFPFIVSNNITLSGRILQGSPSGFNQILMSISKKKEKSIVRFIGESHPLNSEKFELPMYMYQMLVKDDVTNNDMQYYNILSRDRLPLEEVEIKGMAMPIKDTLKVGNTSVIDINTNTIFVISYSKVLKSIDDSEYLTILKNYDSHDKLYQEVFSILRQPELFEKFLMALLLSSKGAEGYPSHLGLFGPASTGKSKILEAVTGTYNESRVFETSTMKGLTPNFGGNRPDVGQFIKCKRYCCVDEFLNMLIKSDKIEEVATLNSLIEHHIGLSVSGKHNESIAAVPTATMWFVSNFKPGRVGNFVELCNKMDVPFLSRFILYNYTDKHIEFIKNREDIVAEAVYAESVRQKKNVTISELIGRYNPTFIKFTDYLKNRVVLISQKEVNKIFQEVKQIVPEDYKINELYIARSKKHITAIIDGITKYRYVINQIESTEFIATEEDYKLAEDIWYMIVGSWVFDPTRLPIQQRISALTEKEMIVYLTIKKNQNLNLYDIEAISKVPPHGALNNLLDYKLIKLVEMGKSKTYVTYDYSDIDEKQMGL